MHKQFDLFQYNQSKSNIPKIKKKTKMKPNQLAYNNQKKKKTRGKRMKKSNKDNMIVYK